MQRLAERLFWAVIVGVGFVAAAAGLMTLIFGVIFVLMKIIGLAPHIIIIGTAGAVIFLCGAAFAWKDSGRQ